METTTGHLFDPQRKSIGFSTTSLVTKVFYVQGRDSNWAPPVDVVDADDHVEFRAEVPGLSEDDVHVSVTENVLTIKGEKKSESEDKDSGYHLVERSYGQFQRSFSLPRNLRTDDIDASFTRGVLTISVPKTKKEEAKEIPIRTD